MTPDKPAWKTTAFLSCATSAGIAFVAAIAQFIPANTAVVITAALTMVFTICNAWIKQNTPVDPPKP